MKRILTIAILLHATLRLAAQPQKTLSLLSGYTIPNSSEWDYIKDISIGIDGALSWRQNWGFEDTNGYFPLLRFPYDMGVRGNFTCFPNGIAGQRIGVSGFIQEPIMHFDRWITFDGDSVPSRVPNYLNLEMECGIAFYTNPYSRTPNPENVFIGSHLNCLVQLGLSYSHRLRDYSQIVFAAKFAHSSNGYLKKPNKGLNYLQLSVGYSLPQRYNPVTFRVSNFDTIDHSRQTLMPVVNWQQYWPYGNPAFRGVTWLLTYSPGVVMPRYTGASRKYFYAHTAQAGWLYRFNPARAVGATLDLTYNYSHIAVIRHWHEDYRLPVYIGIAGVYEATYHRLTLHTALAAYLARSEHGTTPLYERVGLYYNLSGENRRIRHFVGIALKSHMAHIDFIEWHYGIKWRTK
ncbi:MAG: acyloxyacyl hydrolase [Bacteroidales bacterium]|nr:acyloxyacyl hydrolase [Bacteroidales bacterium]